MKYVILILVFLLSKICLLYFILDFNFYKIQFNFYFIRIWHSKYRNYFVFLISFFNNLFFVNLFNGNFFNGNVSIVVSAQDVKNLGTAILQNAGNIEHQDSVTNVDANIGDDNGEAIIIEEKVVSYWDEKVNILGHEVTRKTALVVTVTVAAIAIIGIGVAYWYFKSGGNVTIQDDDEEKVVIVPNNIDLRFYDENGNLEGSFNETTQVIEDGYINDGKIYDSNGIFKDFVDVDSYDDDGILVRHYDEEGRVFDRHNLFIGFSGENDTIVSTDNVVYTKDRLFYDGNLNFIGFAGDNNTIITLDNRVYNQTDVILDENDIFIGFKKNESEFNTNLTKDESSSSINDDEYQVDNLQEIKLTNIDDVTFDEILNNLTEKEMNFLNNSKRSYTQDQLADRVVEYWNYKTKIDNNITLDDFFVVKSSLQVKYMGTDHVITDSEIKEYNEQRINSKNFFNK